jgi:hypothetical protein
MAEIRSSYDFVCACFSVKHGAVLSELTRCIRRLRWNWDDVVRVSAREMVLPALYGRLQAMGIADDVPDDVAACLRAVRDLSLERNRHILSDLAVVARVRTGWVLNPSF